jgi:hypothetical protein
MAAIAVFVPPYLIVIAGAPHYRRLTKQLASEGVRSGRDGGSGGGDCGSCAHSWQAFVNSPTNGLNCPDNFRAAQFQENPGTILDSCGRNGGSAAFQRVGHRVLTLRAFACSGPLLQEGFTNCLHSPAAP